ncbi:MAG: phospholipid carrier-dependent glycosyltransferase [archaeon]
MQEGKFRNLLRDKPVLVLLVIILVLGIFVRVYDFNEVGMWNDDQSTIPAGLLWFYEHDSYPGLSGQGEPALGNLLIGAGCMLSGEDFSKVEQIVPMFYPGREMLLNNLSGVINYCKMPVVVFGIILLFLVAIIALLVLDKYAALFATAFYAFYPPLLQFSTFIHVDVFAYVFVLASLIALYIFYTEKKGSTKEKIWFAIAVMFASLAFGTKLPGAIFVVFAFLLLAEKNFETIKNFLGKTLDLSFVKKDGEVNLKPLVENLLIGAGVAATTVYLVFEFSFKNVIAVITKYRTDSSTDLATLGFNTEFFKYIYAFFFKANIFDILLLLVSIYLLVNMIINFKNLHKNEKFLLYLYAVFIGINLLMGTFKIIRVMIMFSFPIILVMSSSLSSRFSPVPKHWRRGFVLLFIIIYSIFGFIIAFNISPHFIGCNYVLEPFNPEMCNKDYSSMATKQIANKLDSMMEEDETFLPVTLDMLYYYLNPEQSYTSYQFRVLFRQQTGSDPSLENQAKYFVHPTNKTARYVLINTVNPANDPMTKKLLFENNPNEIVYLKKWPVMNIYDLSNLQPRVI